jgi:GntR family transcriptional repressor for pyruvate dehydrogenase complex
MPIQAVDDRRLYRQIADQLTMLITSGEFRRGERLPSERDLAVQLGVSRPSVREALIALEIQGLVEVRVGAGIFVAQAERPAAVPVNEGQGPFELLRARWLIEGEIAALAAREATKADLAQVRAAVEAMQQAASKNQETVAADRDFHMRIAAGTHNGALVSVVLYLWDRGRGAMWQRMEEHFQTPEMRASALKEHWAILAALEARDARKSRAAMRGHIRRVSADFAQGWELLKRQKSAAPGPRRRVRAIRSPGPER